MECRFLAVGKYRLEHEGFTSFFRAFVFRGEGACSWGFAACCVAADTSVTCAL